MRKNILFSGLLALITCLPIQAKVFDITQFGAKPGGQTINTTAIQKAIDAAAIERGTVVIPRGVFLTGTIFLKSGITFELQSGAVLLGSGNIKDYKAVRWGHHEDRTPWHLVVALNAKDIVITGMGTIDGNGSEFWKKDRKHNWAFYTEIEERPSPMIEIDGCENVLVEKIRIANSGGWGLHFLNCKQVMASNLVIRNNKFGPNSDGIDVTGCERVIITGCDILVGDDAIALKTTEDSGPCLQVSVTNCILETNCVAFRVGYESRKDFRDITLSNCVVPNSSRIIDIRSVEGAVIERVNISNITGTTNSGWPINRVIEMELDTANTPYPIAIKEHPNYGKRKPTPKFGAIRNITISNLDIETDGRIMMAAAPGAEAKNITLSNIRLSYPMIDEPNPLAQKAKSLGFFRRMPEVREAHAAFVFKNIENLSLSGVQVNWPTYPVPESWNLLNTEWRKLNSTWYDANEKEIKSGVKKPDFSLVWGRDLNKATLDLKGNSASSGNLPIADVQGQKVIVLEK